MDSNPASTRERILQVAIVLISQKGYAKTSTRDIAAALSIASPSLYHHFPSKEAILAAILAEPVAYLEEVYQRALPLKSADQREVLLDGLLTALELQRGIIVTISDEMDQLSVDFRESIAGHLAHVSGLIASQVSGDNPRLRLAMAAGAVRAAIKDLMIHEDGANGVKPAFRENLPQIKAILKQVLFGH